MCFLSVLLHNIVKFETIYTLNHIYNYMNKSFWKLIELHSELKKFQRSIKLIKYLLELNNK